MVEFDFPNPKELHNEHFPDKKFRITVRFRENEHSKNPESFIGNIPKNTKFFSITCTRGWNSDTWNRLENAYKNEGYETHLKRSSGTTKTRSGRSKHAPTQLFVW